MTHKEKADRAVMIAKRIDKAKKSGEAIKPILHILQVTAVTARRYHRKLVDEGEKALRDSIELCYKNRGKTGRKTKRSESNSLDSLYREYDGQCLFNKIMGIDVTKKHSMGQIWVNEQ